MEKNIQSDEHNIPPPEPPQADHIQTVERETVNASQAEVPPSPQAQPQESKRITGVMIGIVLTVIIAITFAVIGFMMFSKKDVFFVGNDSVMETRSSGSDYSEKNTHQSDLAVQDTQRHGGSCEDLSGYIRANSGGGEITDGEINAFVEDLMVKNDAIHTQEEACFFALFIIVAGEDASLDEYMSDNEICFIAEKIIDTCSDDDIAFLHDALVQYFDNAQKNEILSSIRSLVAATVPGAIHCMDDNAYLIEPSENDDICRGGTEDHGKWTVISEYGGRWGGCDMEVKRNNGIMTGFAYCATLPDGSIAQCTERGCNYDFADASNNSSAQNDDVDDLSEVTDVNIDTRSEVTIGDETY
jgi:hypothetical protein